MWASTQGSTRCGRGTTMDLQPHTARCGLWHWGAGVNDAPKAPLHCAVGGALAEVLEGE